MLFSEILAARSHGSWYYAGTITTPLKAVQLDYYSGFAHGMVFSVGSVAKRAVTVGGVSAGIPTFVSVPSSEGDLPALE